MRYYLDEDQPWKAAGAAGELGLDVTSSLSCGNNGAIDEAQLTYAAAQGRVLVTRNYRDFARLTLRFQSEGRPHAGVLLVVPALSGDRYWEIARALKAFDDAYGAVYPDHLPAYTVMHLPPAP